MVDKQCGSGLMKVYTNMMSDFLKKIDSEATNDFVKLAVAVVGFYLGIFMLEYVDAEYSLWLTWFLTPVIVTFLLPAVIIVLIYMSSIIFHLYRLYRLRVVDGVQNDWKQAARLAVCALWDAHGWLWHGYDIEGLENIPDGPFLVIYYHGALPIDMYYFTARVLLFKRRLIHTVADRFMFKIPGWSSLLEGLCVIPGTVQTCAGVLRAGNPLAISPGGVYEAQFGDHYYRLNWKSRVGFAKVAQEAKVPIVPMFTRNVREAFRTVGWLRGICLRIYAATRIPLAPVYGGFPVKLVTHLGKPIPYDASLTPDQLQQKVASAIEDLVEEHQRLPGSIFRALLERFYEVPKKLKYTQSFTNGNCQNGTIDKYLNSTDNKDVVKSETVAVKCDIAMEKSDRFVEYSDEAIDKSNRHVVKSDRVIDKDNSPIEISKDTNCSYIENDSEKVKVS